MSIKNIRNDGLVRIGVKFSKSLIVVTRHSKNLRLTSWRDAESDNLDNFPRMGPITFLFTRFIKLTYSSEAALGLNSYLIRRLVVKKYKCIIIMKSKVRLIKIIESVGINKIIFQKDTI